MEYPTEQWAGWVALSSRLVERLVDLHERRMFWRAYRERLARQRDLGAASYFHDWITLNYVEAYSIGMRRMVDRSQHTESLTRLLDDLARHASEITFARYRTLWGTEPSEADEYCARRGFARFSRNGRTLDAAMVRRDINELRRRVASVERWAHTRIAHAVPEERKSEEVRFEEAEAALDHIAETLRKYHALLTVHVITKFEPTIPVPWTQAIDRLFES